MANFAIRNNIITKNYYVMRKQQKRLHALQSAMRHRRGLVTALSVLAMAMVTMTSCENDVLSGQPEWLGNSIYEHLQDEGNYTTLLKLIDDVHEDSTLQRTGSKTFFAADDEAFNRWFQHNSWGVGSYGQLSNAQKRILVMSAMINNANLISMLSNTYDTQLQPGTCMRRANAVSVLDSVRTLRPDEMPLTADWDAYRTGEGMKTLEDGTTAPMILFLPDFMRKNGITNEDLAVLTNGEATSTDEVWVNSRQVTEADITCKNGYIHKVSDVIEPAPNMAQALHQHPDMSIWASLIDRFSAPYVNNGMTEEYNRQHHTDTKLYEKRYFSDNSQGFKALDTDPEGNKVDATLSFDPGWNQYMYVNTMGYGMHRDAAAMIVPTNEALLDWWNKDGRALQDEYGTMDKVPLLVLSKLLNVNMLSSFTEAVPSKFNTVVNDAKVTMGIKAEDVDSSFLCCNGVVYLVNKVFPPSAYASVSFPALVHQSTMSVIYWAIDNLDFAPYLNSMDSRFSLFVPTNDAMLNYIDPTTYGQTQQTMLSFYFDTVEKKVKAHQTLCRIADDGTITMGSQMGSDASDEVVNNRLKDLLNTIIVVGDVEDGHRYYPTKGGSMLRVDNAGIEGTMTVSGGWQTAHNQSVTVDKIFDLSTTGNGKTYICNAGMPLGTQESVYTTLKGHPEYSSFLALMTGSDLMVNEMGSGTVYKCVNDKNNFNVRVFDNFNYTVYVPTNAALNELHEKGILPTWDDYNAQTADAWGGDASKAAKAKEIIKERITNFLRYHIQDNSIYAGGLQRAVEGGNARLETALLNSETRRFYSLGVNVSNDDITVTDLAGNTHRVVKTNGLYNNTCREYWISGSGINKQIYSVSDAVVQYIDGALFYSSEAMKPWKDEVK